MYRRRVAGDGRFSKVVVVWASGPIMKLKSWGNSFDGKSPAVLFGRKDHIAEEVGDTKASYLTSPLTIPNPFMIVTIVVGYKC